MSEALTIPKEISADYGSSFGFLKEAGLNHIQQLSGKLWTDYNSHDPGITMLELLCYAITDLGYRISMPVEDILASKNDNMLEMHKHFLSALNSMPCAPVNSTDYRKLLVRIDGVKNAWLVKAEHTIIADYNKQPAKLHYAKEGEKLHQHDIPFQLKGLYNILIEYDEMEDTDELAIATKRMDILRNVKTVYHHFRNLCEDAVEIVEVPEQKFILCSEIELEPKADPENVWANIMAAVDNYLSPNIHFYSLQEMLDKKKTTDEIFEGPVFDFDQIRLTSSETNDKKIFTKKGFIDTDEILKSGLRTEVRLSDLINIIMKIDGVKVINAISIKPCCCCSDPSKDEPLTEAQQWILCVKNGYKPVLNIAKSVLNFYKDVIPIELKANEANSKLDALKLHYRLTQQSDKIEDLSMPLGTFNNISDYGTIQNHFPETYGINQVGLSPEVDVKRKALAKQLKAYLLFFDQVLANYFSQLANSRNLLSANDDVKKTYFSNTVKNLKGVEEIFSNPDDWEATIDGLIKDARLDNYVERKNRFLDHLLSRFSEQFNDYVFILHRIYNQDFDQAIIRQKVNFYSDYQQISSFRGSALDYYNKKTAEDELINVSGLEKRVSRMLGFNNYKKVKLAGQPYTVEKVTPADTASPYTWTIELSGKEILKGTGAAKKEADAIEELGLATILGCDRDHYIFKLNAAKTKVEFSIVDASKTQIALSAKQYDVTVSDANKGIYPKAEQAVTDLIQYFLTDFKLEGIYVVEHILLRPDIDSHHATSTFMPVCIDPNGIYCKPIDPYSFRITVVLPGYTMRLRNIDFRKYVERIIRMETPAHILPKICFIGEDQMKKFEKLYNDWLSARINSSNPELQVKGKLLKDFIDLIEDLFTVYPEGQLVDCNDDTEEKNSIVLGRTYLGTLDIDTKDLPS